MRKRNGQRLALDHVLGLLHEDQREGCSRRLPGIAALAESAGVCRMTMIRALRTLQERGLVTVEPGKGVFRAGPDAQPAAASPPPEHQDSPASASVIVTNALRRDVLRGLFPPGSRMPSMKELGGRYGVNYRTVRKALAALAEQQLLCRSGRAYAVSHSHTASRSHALLVFYRGFQPLHYVPAPTLAIVRLLSDAAVSQELRLEFWPCPTSSPADVRSAALRHHLERSLGAIVIASQVGVATVREIVGRAKRLNRPVSIFDDIGGIAEQVADVGGRLTRCFLHACGRIPGRDVGLALLQAGHRHVAFVSPYDSPWARNRLAGLRDVLASAPQGGRVRAYVQSLRHEEDFDEAVDRSLHAAGEVLRRSELDSRADPERVRMTARKALDAYLRHLRHMDAIEYTTAPLVDRVLEDPSITAIAAATDLSAFACLSRLRALGVSVPRRMSVVGFDNHHGAIAAGLTTYDFGTLAIAQAMLHHVVRPHQPFPFRRSGQAIELHGRLQERRSLASPRLVAPAG